MFETLLQVLSVTVSYFTSHAIDPTRQTGQRHPHMHRPRKTQDPAQVHTLSRSAPLTAGSRVLTITRRHERNLRLTPSQPSTACVDMRDLTDTATLIRIAHTHFTLSSHSRRHPLRDSASLVRVPSAYVQVCKLQRACLGGARRQLLHVRSHRRTPTTHLLSSTHAAATWWGAWARL